MYILAIDASTKSTGIAYFKDKELIYYDCFTAKSNDVISRITRIIMQLNNFMKDRQIDKIILEEPFNDKVNKNTTRALMWLQAAINFLVHDRYSHIEIEYILPNSWRSKIGIHTGPSVKRDELKAADIKYVKDKYDIDVNDDIADAICIGLSLFEQNKRDLPAW